MTRSCAVRFNGVRMCPPARYNYRPDLFTRFGNILFVVRQRLPGSVGPLQQTCRSCLADMAAPAAASCCQHGRLCLCTHFRLLRTHHVQNGEVDPWAGASVTASLSRRVPAVILPSAGHCADLW